MGRNSIMGWAKKQGCETGVLSCLEGWLGELGEWLVWARNPVEEVIANYMGFTGMRHDCKTSDRYHR